MWKIIVSTLVIVSVMLALGLAPHAPAAPQDAAKLRVGVYDNRAITGAWFHSQYNDLMENSRKEYAQAKEAGDEERMKEIQAQGPVVQRRLHFQGFGRAPVTDLLRPIEDQLPALAKRLGVDVIAFECNYAGENVQVVDITLDLVKLYDPTPDTLTGCREIMEQDPVPLEELTDDDH